MKVTEKSEFKPHPPTDGPIRAVIVDITEPKKKDTKYGEKEKFAIVFETESKNEDGEHWTHWDHGYTPSWAEKSTLRKNVTKMLGYEPAGGEFDTEDLIGKSVKIIIEHKTSEGKTYANITYYGADKSDTPFKGSGTYERLKDREKTDTGSSYNKAEGQAPEKEKWQQTKVHVGKFSGQHLENLDVDAINNLITHWLPTVTKPESKPTADDKRLIHALQEAQKMLVPAESSF